MLFSVEPAMVRGQVVLRIEGELDVATVPVLASAVTAQLQTPPHSLFLDLSDTTFMDSTGARELARSARAAASCGTALRVICPPDNHPVRRAIDLLELRAAMDIVDAIPSPAGGVGS